MVGYPFDYTVYSAEFWTEVINTKADYYTDLYLNHTANIITIQEESRMKLAGHSLLFDAAETITLPATASAGEITVYLEINVPSNSYSIKTSTSYTGDSGTLDNIYNVAFMTITHSGGSVNPSDDDIVILYAGGGGSGAGSGVIYASQTGYNDNNYSGGTTPWNNTRNLFDRIIYTEIDRLAVKYPKTVLQVYFQVASYPILQASLTNINASIEYFILTLDTITKAGDIKFHNSATNKTGIASVARNSVARNNIGFYFMTNPEKATVYETQTIELNEKNKRSYYYDLANNLTETQVEQFLPKAVIDVEEGDIVDWTNARAKDDLTGSGGYINDLDGCKLLLYTLGYRTLTSVQLGGIEFKEPVQLDSSNTSRTILVTDSSELYYSYNFKIDESTGSSYNISENIQESGSFYPIINASGSLKDLTLTAFGTIIC